jgi:hypothetical protein
MSSTVITEGDRNLVVSQASCRMDVIRLEQRAYIKIAVLRGRNAIEVHSELVEAVGNNDLSYRTVARWATAFQRVRATSGLGIKSGQQFFPLTFKLSCHKTRICT